ncbi:MAG: HAMP domain-containing histidine kinase, partial [Clostridia bacterium]|nr:HAMP domain-containing histidine kinase [Clostridia bacterium]
MIRKLRIKLVAVSMLSLFIVLGAIVAAANIVSWRGIVSGADMILDLLAENGGAIPERMRVIGRSGMTQETFGSAYIESGVAAENGAAFSEPPELREFDKKPDQMPGQMPGGKRDSYFSEETAFENRYFSVSLDQSGAVLSCDMSYIAAVTEDEAVSYADEAYRSGSERGFCGSYRFLRSDRDDGTLMIVLDRTRDIETFRGFLRSSVLISAAGLTAVFLLITLLSSRIVRPISESYEKQKRFITDAGHEIKTPITIIDADAEVLGMDIGDDNEWLTDIRKQTKRLAGLTSDLIYLAKMEEGSALPQAKLIEFPLSDVASECAGSFSGIAKAQGKSFDVDIAPGITMKGEEKSVTQLINILLDNAMKYSTDGGRVSAKLSRSGRSIRLSVSNDAPPMSKDDIA